MSSLRVYFKGEGVEPKGTSQHQLTLSNGHDQWVQSDERGFYVRVNVHAGQYVIDPTIAHQLTLVTMGERITDTVVIASIKRGEYRRGSTRANVLGTRNINHDFTSGEFEVEESVQVEISARTPKAALRMFDDILSNRIQPTIPYGI